MSLVDTLLVDGTSLLTVPSLSFDDLSGLLASGPYRGGNRTIPGMPGQVSYAKPRDAYAFVVGISLGPEDGSGALASSAAAQRIQFLSNYAALQALFPDNLCTLTRRLSKTLSPFYVDTTCSAEFLGFTITNQPTEATMSGQLAFLNLDGEWA